MSEADALTAVLQNAQSADAAARTQAEAQLKGLEASNFALFVVLLAGELANEGKPEQTRRLSGLVLKNAVFSDDEKRAAERAAAWAGVDTGSKQTVRAHLLSALNSPVRRRAGGGNHPARPAPGRGGALSPRPLECRSLCCALTPCCAAAGQGGAPHGGPGHRQGGRPGPGRQAVARAAAGAQGRRAARQPGRQQAGDAGGAGLRVRGAGPERAGAGAGQRGPHRGGGGHAGQRGRRHPGRRHQGP